MTKIVISILIAIAASVPAVALPADPLVVIRGQRLITDLRSVRQFLYADDANAERIAGAVLDALFSERFGDDVSFDSVLGQIGDVPYLFVVDQRDGKHVWGLLVPSSSSTRELSQTLLDHHRMQRGNAVIRERTVPSGKQVRSVTVRSQDVMDDYVVHKRRGWLAFGNNEPLLHSMLQGIKKVPRPTFSLSPVGFPLFRAPFPDSDVLRYFALLLNEQNDQALSLSSWRCMPYHTSAFPLFSYAEE